MDCDDLRHFAAFVSAGSLSGAARQLAIEHATVARRIAALEARLGLKLVDRRGRRLVLDGERVAAIATRMGEDVRALERLAAGARSELAGEVAISAPAAYAAAVLAPKLAELGRRHPDLRIRLLGEARLASLERREADIAVRLSRPERGDLTGVRIGTMAFRLYAAPAYLAETSEVAWRFIGNEGAMAGAPRRQGWIRLPRRPCQNSTRARPCRRRHRYAAGLHDRGGRSIRPRPSRRPPLLREVWLVFHTDMKASAPVRAVIDCLRDTGS